MALIGFAMRKQRAIDNKFQRLLDSCNLSVDGCWNWNKSLTIKGYGKFGGIRVNGKSNWKIAHRVSYELFYGEIPKGLFVCHTCDNPKCVNPDHLWLGTNNDNVQDMIRKGRKHIPTSESVSGEKNPNSRLKLKQVQEIKFFIKEGNKTLKEIADLYSVTGTLIWRIKDGRAWKE